MARRQLLALGFVLTVSLLFSCGGGSKAVHFPNGVASGDASKDGAVLWTRTDRAALLTVEVATDAAFEHIAASRDVGVSKVGNVPTRAKDDFVARTIVGDLQSATTYYYRFRHGDDLSDTGSFRTAPQTYKSVPVRFVFTGDSDGAVRSDGTRPYDFKVLDAALADRPDFFLYVGDTIYSTSPDAATATTLDGFREKYKENRTLEPLRKLLEGTSTFAIWDDGEVANNYAGTTVDPALLAAAQQAFHEYMPIGGPLPFEGPGVHSGLPPLYRNFRWGDAVEVIILDTRTFRDADASAACTPAGATTPDVVPALGAPGMPDAVRALRSSVGLPAESDPACLAALNDANRTMLGAKQKQFLINALSRSTATFKIVVTPDPIAELLAQPYDRWEGYRAERDEILQSIGDKGIKNVIFLTADLHASMVSPILANSVLDAARAPTAILPPPIAWEFMTGPIGRETLGQTITKEQGEQALPVFEGLFKQLAQVECVDLDAYSYGLVEIDPTAGSATVTLKNEHGATLCKKEIAAS